MVYPLFMDMEIHLLDPAIPSSEPETNVFHAAGFSASASNTSHFPVWRLEASQNRGRVKAVSSAVCSQAHSPHGESLTTPGFVTDRPTCSTTRPESWPTQHMGPRCWLRCWSTHCLPRYHDFTSSLRHSLPPPPTHFRLTIAVI